MKTPSIVVVDDFLPDPDAVRERALRATYTPSDYHKGRRSSERFLDVLDPADVSRLLSGIAIDDWAKHAMSGRAQFCTSQDPIVYHSDFQHWAGAIYLTPDAPLESGLTLYRSRVTGARRPPEDPTLAQLTYDGNLYDPTKWDVVDKIGNVYNRLVLWDGQLIHSASCYFGNKIEDARLFLIFFFD